MTKYIKLKKAVILFLLCFWFLVPQAQESNNTTVVVSWGVDQVNGTVDVSFGRLNKLSVSKGRATANKFTVSGSPARLTLTVADAKTQIAPEQTVVHIKSDKASFSFFLRDVKKNTPIFIPEYKVAVSTIDDNRSYAAIEVDILSRKLKTKVEKIEGEREASFEQAAEVTRDMSVPIWLGTSRDMRIFELSESLPDAAIGEANIISPKLSSTPLRLEETKNGNVNYLYTMGRGVGVLKNITRRLEDGVLPILNSQLVDDDVVYNSTAFVALERTSLKELKGTDFLVADQYSAGHMFTEEQLEQLKTRKPAALNTNEETMLFFKSNIVNEGSVPRYAWFKIPRPGTGWWGGTSYKFEHEKGFSLYENDKVFCISRLNGKAMPNEEVAILLQPGESAIVEFFIPHSPVSKDRAAAIAKLNFEHKFEESKTFWSSKLQTAATIEVPEKRINEMIQAGLLHLDLITFGNEPNGTLAANIGVYSPIGTESSPIIQYYASIGKLEEARRSLNYFLDKQHDNGFIQNFGGYMVETGAALWSMGEYYRYTGDKQWVLSIKDKLLKSCNFLIDWRNKNKKEELRGKGYGMIDGKVADPEDHFHQFMLNGYAYLGMSRIAEVLKEVDPIEHKRIQAETDAWREDIRTAFFKGMAESPVVPLGDGTWCPTVPPWAEANTMRAMFQKREKFWSHGTFTAPDAMLGPLYLVFCEVLDPKELASKMLLSYHSEIFYQGNTTFSQPYYSRHNWVQAKLGMVKPFLNTYYYTVSAHADRETYSFWEHMYKVSPHKTHEEAWFLMETRWMLYMEDGDTLNLFKTIPRKWLEDGKVINLKGVKSYFGTLNVEAVSKGDVIAAKFTASGGSKKPKIVKVRLPHPDGKLPVKVTGGKYDPATESVIMESFNEKGEVTLHF